MQALLNMLGRTIYIFYEETGQINSSSMLGAY